MGHSGWGVRFVDYDNSGRKGLLIAQGHDLDTVELNFPSLHYREPMLLARNTGQDLKMFRRSQGRYLKRPGWPGAGARRYLQRWTNGCGGHRE